MTGRHATNKRWRLRIVQQPEAEFFKDEGGKNHALEAVVRLEPLGGHHLPARYAPGDFVVPLRAALYYESERRVEESDQDILRMMATDPKSMWVRSDDNECHVRFRIEKVSRRKDGQRFKVLFEVDDSGECPDEFKHMKPVLTEPICVMSKRKAHAVGGRGRTRRRGAPDDVVATLDPEVIRKMERMQHLIGQLRSQVTDQSKRIEALEQSVYEAGQGAAMGGAGGVRDRGRAAAPFPSSGLMGLAQAADVHGGGQGSDSPSHATERGSAWRGGSDLKLSPADSRSPEGGASGFEGEGGSREGVQTRSSARLTRRRGRRSLRQVSTEYGHGGRSTARGVSNGDGAGGVELDDEDLRGALALSRGSSRNGSPRSPSGTGGLGEAGGGTGLGTMGSPIAVQAAGAYARAPPGSQPPRGPRAYSTAATVADMGEGSAPAAKRFRRGSGDDGRGGGAAPTSATLSAAVGGSSAPMAAPGEGHGDVAVAPDSSASTPASAPVAGTAVASATYPTDGGMMRAALVPVSRVESSGSMATALPGLSLQRPDDALSFADHSTPPQRLSSSDMQFDFGPPGSPVERSNGLTEPAPKEER